MSLSLYTLKDVYYNIENNTLTIPIQEKPLETGYCVIGEATFFFIRNTNDIVSIEDFPEEIMKILQEKESLKIHEKNSDKLYQVTLYQSNKNENIL